LQVIGPHSGRQHSGDKAEKHGANKQVCEYAGHDCESYAQVPVENLFRIRRVLGQKSGEKTEQVQG